MNTAKLEAVDQRNGARTGRPGPGRLSRWIWLLVGLVCIWAFMFVLVPALNDLPLFKPLIAFNVEHDIKAKALFYSDVEETSEAQNYLKNSKVR